jgi:hypothetical protein
MTFDEREFTPLTADQVVHRVVVGSPGLFTTPPAATCSLCDTRFSRFDDASGIASKARIVVSHRLRCLATEFS